MTNAVIDNSITGLEVVLWQYDKAVNFLNLVKAIIGDFGAATGEFWDSFHKNVFDLSTANSFGLAVWGILLGKGRANIVNADGVFTPISNGLYRKILMARLRHLNGNRSMADLNAYLFELFGGAVVCSDNLDMTITHSLADGGAASLTEEEMLLVEQNPDYLYLYPAGVYEPSSADALWFGFDGQQIPAVDEDGDLKWEITNFGETHSFYSDMFESIVRGES